MSAVAFQTGGGDAAPDGHGGITVSPQFFIDGIGSCSVPVTLTPAMTAIQAQQAVRDAAVAFAATQGVTVNPADVFTIVLSRG